MPLPTPRDGEDYDSFIDRCMGDDVMVEEFPDVKQRRAVCERQWDDHKGEEFDFPYLAGIILNNIWAVAAEKMGLLLNLLATCESRGYIAAADVRELLGIRSDSPNSHKQGDEIAILPLMGFVNYRYGWLGTSVLGFRKSFRAALNDPAVRAIVIDVDSPGGSIDGVSELAAEIYNARGRKPIIALANNQAASAAYWLASSAEEFVATPSGDVGAIGVFAVHDDVSGLLEKYGIRRTLIYQGKYKVEGNPYQPLTEEAKTAIQARVDECYDSFVLDVARNRGVSDRAVREGFGEGRLVSAKKALSLGMIDRIATFDEVLSDLQARVVPTVTVSKAQTEETEMDWEKLTLEDLKAHRPDLVEAAASDAIGQAEALTARIAELEAALAAAKPAEEVQAELAETRFQLALAQAAHVGVSKLLYGMLQERVTSLEQLEERLPELRLAALNAFIKDSKERVPTEFATGKAHPRSSGPEGTVVKKDEPDEDSSLPAEFREIQRLIRKRG